jgi:hypothetical protein
MAKHTRTNKHQPSIHTKHTTTPEQNEQNQDHIILKWNKHDT